MTAWWYWLLVAVWTAGAARCGWLLWRRRRWSIRYFDLRFAAHQRLVEDIYWMSRRDEAYRLALALRAHRLATSEPVPLRLIHTAVSEL